MIAKTGEDGKITMITKYGEVVTCDRSTIFKSLRFWIWYWRYLRVWKDPITELDGKTVRTF